MKLCPQGKEHTALGTVQWKQDYPLTITPNAQLGDSAPLYTVLWVCRVGGSSEQRAILLSRVTAEVPLKCMLQLLPGYFGLCPETTRVEEKPSHWQRQLDLMARGHGAPFHTVRVGRNMCGTQWAPPITHLPHCNCEWLCSDSHLRMITKDAGHPEMKVWIIPV